jgi:FAD/FMN-containing dehydrogenase
MTSLERLTRTLEKDLSKQSVFTDVETCNRYQTDWTKTPGMAEIVALPKSTEEVSQILRRCLEFKVAVVPAGGRG